MAIGFMKKARVLGGRIIPNPISRFAKKHLPRKYYVESVITHENAAERFVRRIRHRRPVLHHLDVHVTDHCNLNCRGCEPYSSIAEPVFRDLDETVADLERLSELFENIEQIYLMGGEPLLHHEVESFIRETRRVFPKTRLSLMTNGILLSRMPDSFWEALHDTDTTLMCDSYPIKLPVAKIDAAGDAHNVRIEWMKPNEEFFRVPLKPIGSCDPEHSFSECRGLSNCANIRHGHLFTCARVAYADILINRFQLEGYDPTPEDSFNIYADVTGDDALDFLTHPVPYCSHCDFDSFETYAWCRTSGDVEEWVDHAG